MLLTNFAEGWPKYWKARPTATRIWDPCRVEEVAEVERGWKLAPGHRQDCEDRWGRGGRPVRAMGLVRRWGGHCSKDGRRVLAANRKVGHVQKPGA